MCVCPRNGLAQLHIHNPFSTLHFHFGERERVTYTMFSSYKVSGYREIMKLTGLLAFFFDIGD